MTLLKPNVEKLAAKGDVPGLVSALGSAHDDVRAKAVEAVVRLGVPAIEPLIAAVDDAIRSRGEVVVPKDSDALMSRARTRAFCLMISATKVFEQLGEAAVDALLAAIKNRALAPQTRGLMANMLGDTGSARAARPLLFYATARCPMEIQRGAVWGLRRLRQPEVLPGLIDILMHGGDAAMVAEMWLVDWGEAARPLLVDIVRELDAADVLNVPGVLAACALARLGDDSGYVALRCACFEGNDVLRREAVRASGHLLAAYRSGLQSAEPDYPESLQQYLEWAAANDENAVVRHDAELALSGGVSI